MYLVIFFGALVRNKAIHLAPVYKIDAAESMDARLRKLVNTRGHFPNDDAASTLIWPPRGSITTDWGRPAHNCK
ncbi:transposase-like protein [Variovorax boronicumulans]|uniref:hypothetical protein n=1 Tax=Variovorax boronicumulans TaxID=436515 RepID=UPI00277FB95C|nr:hypothetical protein [Variovorax boronicumulans]MDQ0083798.1 transposase-like protein [Variovorax boronicumulans]